jgi:hypothetical protein
MFSFRSSLSSLMAAITLAFSAGGGCPASGGLSPEPVAATAPLDLGRPAEELKLVSDPNLFLLEVKVDGKGPFLFSVDSGLSARVCLSDALRRQLKLPRGRGMFSDDGGGQVGYLPGSRVPSISVGEVKWTDLPVLIEELDWLKTEQGRKIDGIVGLRFFGDKTIQFDGTHNVIRLFDAQLPRSSQPQTTRFRLRRGVPYCWMQAGAHNFPVLLDTGYDGGIAMPYSFRDKVICYDQPRLTAKLRTAHSSDRKIYSARLKQDAKLAGFRMHHPPVQFLEGYRTGILGGQALRQFVVTLDRRGQRVHFALPKK